MEIKVERKWYTRKSTVGEMFVDGRFECYTLEDVVRAAGVKIAGATAIPAGRYRLILDPSQRFGKLMPHLLDVPEFSGIRIHSGNTCVDTAGCILVGENRMVDEVTNSHLAFGQLFVLLKLAREKGEDVFVTVEDAPAPESQMRPPVEAAEGATA